MKNEYFLLLLFVCVCLFANSCCACFVCLLILCDCLHLLLSPSLALFGNSLSLSLSVPAFAFACVYVVVYFRGLFYLRVHRYTPHTHTDTSLRSSFSVGFGFFVVFFSEYRSDSTGVLSLESLCRFLSSLGACSMPVANLNKNTNKRKKPRRYIHLE